jgi:hypothetical protein
MGKLYDLCECPCHQGSVTSREAPEVSDPIAALTACDRCAVLHLGVWTVVARGPATEGNTNSEGDE